jgi:hypothetical protein
VARQRSRSAPRRDFGNAQAPSTSRKKPIVTSQRRTRIEGGESLWEHLSQELPK